MPLMGLQLAQALAEGLLVVRDAQRPAERLTQAVGFYEGPADGDIAGKVFVIIEQFGLFGLESVGQREFAVGLEWRDSANNVRDIFFTTRITTFRRTGGRRRRERKRIRTPQARSW